MENQDKSTTVPGQDEQPRAKEQVVDPWNVSGAVAEDGSVQPIDYTKLVEQFGTKLIDDALLERFERVTGQKPHRFLRRKIAFSHRQLDVILDLYEQNKPFMLYTGRGPSSTSMHIGHIIPFELTRYLSDVFEAPLVIMLTDDEKYLVGKGDQDIPEYEQFARENARDIIACGYNMERTFIFSDYAFMGHDFYRNISRISKRISRGQADSCFGFTSSTNIGKVHFAAIQAAASFASSFPQIFGPNSKETSQIPCLIPCAIDQDPYFRLTRDVAAQLNFSKPSLIHCRFLDSLGGPGSKMSASVDSSSVKLTDTPKQILKKINTHAFSGGRETLEEHREKGGNPDVDVPYQWLKYYLEDDAELAQIYADYKKGTMLTSEIKKRCADVISAFVVDFQARRAKVTDEVIDAYMRPRPLVYRGRATDTLVPAVGGGVAKKGGLAADPNSKTQAKKAEKLRLAEAKKAQKTREKEEKAKGAAVAATVVVPAEGAEDGTK